MRNHSLDAYRRRTIRAPSGLVLEIGMGSGQNLPLYGSAVDHVCAINPSAELLRLAVDRIADVARRYSAITMGLGDSCGGGHSFFADRLVIAT
jgi:protein-L-isoaspartate O-methyltransferase